MDIAGLSSKTSGFSEGSNLKSKREQTYRPSRTRSQSWKLTKLFSCIFHRRRKPQARRSTDRSTGKDPAPQVSPSQKRTMPEDKTQISTIEKDTPRRFSFLRSRSNTGTSSPPVGSVGTRPVYHLDEQHNNSWKNSKDEVTRVLERNTSGNIGPKPVSLLYAFEVEHKTWTLQRKRAPTIVISCRSQAYGELLKKEFRKSLRSDLFDPSIKEFYVVAMQDNFQPLQATVVV
jgi:hypothetical protein